MFSSSLTPSYFALRVDAYSLIFIMIIASMPIFAFAVTFFIHISRHLILLDACLFFAMLFSFVFFIAEAAISQYAYIFTYFYYASFMLIFSSLTPAAHAKHRSFISFDRFRGFHFRQFAFAASLSALLACFRYVDTLASGFLFLR